MDMIDLDLPLRNRLAHEDVVELFILMVKDIGVPLDGWDIREHVDVEEQVVRVEGRVDRTRLDELVVVTRDDDAGGGIESENRLNESLEKSASGLVRHVCAARFETGCWKDLQRLPEPVLCVAGARC